MATRRRPAINSEVVADYFQRIWKTLGPAEPVTVELLEFTDGADHRATVFWHSDGWYILANDHPLRVGSGHLLHTLLHECAHVVAGDVKRTEVDLDLARFMATGRDSELLAGIVAKASDALAGLDETTRALALERLTEQAAANMVAEWRRLSQQDLEKTLGDAEYMAHEREMDRWADEHFALAWQCLLANRDPERAARIYTEIQQED